MTTEAGAHQTGGSWDPTDRPCYFLAADLGAQQRASIFAYGYVLVPVNVFGGDQDRVVLEELLDADVRILLDSGVFGLASRHARRHAVSLETALSMPPDQIDGFDKLWSDYLRVAGEYGDRIWGYIELDQGGAEVKRRTRRRLEEEFGLAPIPVYHPFNDGWDYFDELADHYDRICLGNVVQAEPATRLRMMATMEERRAAHPDLWIHLLGLTPNEWCNAYQVDSTDSSAWLSSLRWSGYDERAMLAHLSFMDQEFRYRLGDTADESATSDRAALAMTTAGLAAMLRGWRHWAGALSAAGLAPPPA